MKTASKSDLIDQVAAETGLSKKAVGDVTDAVLAAIRAKADAGTPVTIVGFGRFEMRGRAERLGRNPSTGETIKIAASRNLAFKPAKS